jgi:hypothetical protein
MRDLITAQKCQQDKMAIQFAEEAIGVGKHVFLMGFQGNVLVVGFGIKDLIIARPLMRIFRFVKMDIGLGNFVSLTTIQISVHMGGCGIGKTIHAPSKMMIMMILMVMTPSVMFITIGMEVAAFLRGFQDTA